MQTSSDRKLFYSTLTLVLIHLIGFVGTFTPYKDFLLLCTPLNLILSALILFANHKDFNLNFYAFCLVSFSAGYFIELAGVKTGTIFGEYQYGKTLGFKILEVPAIIGINWLILIYSVGCICKNLKTNILIKSIIGALLLVLLDFFIEPIAVKFDYWSWKNELIPLQNYFAWFLASTLLLLIFNSLSFLKNNRIATRVYFIQLTFFLLLNITQIYTNVWTFSFYATLFFVTFICMEFSTWFIHKYVMHGFLWKLHKDHHVGSGHVMEKNDWFFLIFAIPSWLFIMLGCIYQSPASIVIGAGLTAYGIAYFCVHEVFIHQRIKLFRDTDSNYFKALRRAHKMHHKHITKENGESFGFLIIAKKYFSKDKKSLLDN